MIIRRLLNKTTVNQYKNTTISYIYIRCNSNNSNNNEISNNNNEFMILTSSKNINHTAILTLQSINTKNAFSKAMLNSFNDNLTAIANDSSIRCLIITSSLTNVFCTGADLKERIKMTDEEVGPFVSSLRDSFTRLSNLQIPTIAAIDGVALGGGLELALACDLRVVSTNSLIGLPETALAIIPGAGGTQRLTRLIGLSKAKELIFTAKRLTGEEALSYGIANRCVNQGEVLDEAEKIASEIVERGPIAVRMAKLAIDKGIQLDISGGLKIEEICYKQLIATSDRKEGLASFTEKRKPIFIGE